MPDLLTGRQLVAELERRGVGRWGPAIVRRWIHEEPPLPIAERGRPGQSHLYNADAAERWLRERDGRLGMDPSGAQAGAAPESTRAAAAANEVRELLVRAGSEAEYNPTVEAVLAILQGRDPRNWKATEEALMTRMKRLEMLGYTVNVDDMRRCLDAQAQIFQTGVNALRNQLKMALADIDDAALRESTIDEEIDLMLERIADAARSALNTEASNAA